jgi:hypothetical protein
MAEWALSWRGCLAACRCAIVRCGEPAMRRGSNFVSDRQGRHVIDLARALTQLRAERDLIEQVIEQIASLAEARKRGPGRPKALPRAGARAAGRGSEERTLTRRISP